MMLTATRFALMGLLIVGGGCRRSGVEPPSRETPEPASSSSPDADAPSSGIETAAAKEGPEKQGPKKPPSGKLRGIIQLSAHENSTCALDEDGHVYCWGTHTSAIGLEYVDTRRIPFVHEAVHAPLRLSSDAKTRITTMENLGWVVARSTDGRLFAAGPSVRLPLQRGQEMDRFVDEPAPPGFESYDVLARRHPEDMVLVEGTGLRAEVATKRLVWLGIERTLEYARTCWILDQRRFSCRGAYGLPWRSFGQHAVLPPNWELHIVDSRWCAIEPNVAVRCARADVGHTPFDPDQPEVPLPKPPLQLWANGTRACAKLVDHSLACWNEFGRADWPDGVTPEFDHRQIDVVSVAIQRPPLEHWEFDHCAAEKGGKVKCWADRRWLEFALTNPKNAALVPTREVPGIDDARQIVAGDRHTCVLTAKGTVRCFGANEVGQCGTGQASEFEATPVTVVAPAAP